MNTNRNQPLVESSRDTTKQPWNNVYDNVESMPPPPAIGTLQMLPKLPPYLSTSSRNFPIIFRILQVYSAAVQPTLPHVFPSWTKFRWDGSRMLYLCLVCLSLCLYRDDMRLDSLCLWQLHGYQDCVRQVSVHEVQNWEAVLSLRLSAWFV